MTRPRRLLLLCAEDKVNDGDRHGNAEVVGIERDAESLSPACDQGGAGARGVCCVCMWKAAA